MTIALTGAGSLGVRWGHLFAPAADLLSVMGGATTTHAGSALQFPTQFATINTDLAAGTALPGTAAKSQNTPYTQLAQWQSIQASFFAWMAGLAKDYLGAMANLDQSLPELAPYNPTTAMLYLQNQMIYASSGTLAAPTATFQGCTLSIGAQTAGIAGVTGNPIILLTGKQVQGLTQQLIFPETITWVTTQDAQGGAASGNETISFTGLPAAPSVWSQLYPTSGSGCAGSFQCVDGSKSVSTGNLLQNSDYATTTTSNVPDNWTLVTGAAGTDILAGTATGHVYTVGGGSLGFVGDAGGTALKQKVTQSFATAAAAAPGAGGTPTVLTPDTQYGYNFWIIVPAGVPAAGVIRISLQDGAGNILNDDFGTANSQSITLSSGGSNVGNAWFNVNGEFRTPANMTTQTTPFKLVIEVTTAISTSSTLYFGRLAMARMRPLYNGGPYCAIFSGNVATVNGRAPDVWTVAITNTYGQFPLFLDKVFSLRSIVPINGGDPGIVLPYAASSPTIADSLITS
jgi:hypothetical protein